MLKLAIKDLMPQFWSFSIISANDYLPDYYGNLLTAYFSDFSGGPFTQIDTIQYELFTKIHK